MTSYIRAAIFFVICWIVLFFVIHTAWTGDAATSAALLFSGVASIVAAVIYGLMDEIWIAH